MNYEQINTIAPAGLKAIISAAGGSKHRDYDRVVKLQSLYHKLITGEGIESLLQQFNRREDEVMFKQRVNITQAITPSVCSPTFLPFYKVARVNNIVDKIEFDKAEEVSLPKLEKAMREYYGEDSLDSYMGGRFIELSMYDPNAFIVTEFVDGKRNANGQLIEPVRPYPIEYSAEQCVNFQYFNNILQWLIVKVGVEGNEKQGRFIIYLPSVALSMTPVDEKMYPGIKVGDYNDVLFSDSIVRPVIRISETDVYVIELHEHTSTLCPAKRVGYKRDLVTASRTCVSPLEPGIAYLMKSITSNSEMDLAMKLHVFLQKFTYEQRCSEIGCNNGQTAEGGPCKSCGGSGIAKTHTTTQDIVTIPFPRDVKDMFPLSDLVHYPTLQVDLLKFQDDYTNELVNKFKAAVFNSDIFDKNQIAATATEKTMDMESIYDTLYPFALQYASVRIHQLNVIANYLDITDMKVVYKFPKDFRYRTRTQLLDELGKASGAPGYIKNAISTELAELLLVDSPDELKRTKIKERFYPFADKTSTEIVFIISNDQTSQYNAVLWANFNTIFDNAEITASKLSGNPYLYDMTYDKIKEIIDAEVQIQIDALAPADNFNPPQLP